MTTEPMTSSSPPVAIGDARQVLKPCPFCGGAARLQENGSSARRYWEAVCDNCEIAAHDDWERANVIEAWNRRSPVPSPSMDDEGYSKPTFCVDCGMIVKSKRVTGVLPEAPTSIAPLPDGGEDLVKRLRAWADDYEPRSDMAKLLYEAATEIARLSTRLREAEEALEREREE
jgi:Lar family restriction alleviation protein